ncbi:hypothetical protein EmuJ_000499200 [Echinococcus multilocularis]|uniref:Uncharacterized protein n=1 Tax=Echinococcus multilocularis TaxID=6211 RepID=A0A068XZ27_ECHMU|nr:hypothetical protein EmuJ_000499200 [Echinococcus multilocularis]
MKLAEDLKSHCIAFHLQSCFSMDSQLTSPPPLTAVNRLITLMQVMIAEAATLFFMAVGPSVLDVGHILTGTCIWKEVYTTGDTLLKVNFTSLLGAVPVALIIVNKTTGIVGVDPCEAEPSTSANRRLFAPPPYAGFRSSANTTSHRPSQLYNKKWLVTLHYGVWTGGWGANEARGEKRAKDEEGEEEENEAIQTTDRKVVYVILALSVAFLFFFAIGYDGWNCGGSNPLGQCVRYPYHKAIGALLLTAVWLSSTQALFLSS